MQNEVQTNKELKEFVDLLTSFHDAVKKDSMFGFYAGYKGLIIEKKLEKIQDEIMVSSAFELINQKAYLKYLKERDIDLAAKLQTCFKNDEVISNAAKVTNPDGKMGVLKFYTYGLAKTMRLAKPNLL